MMPVSLLRITNFLIIIVSFCYIGCQSKSAWKNYQGGIHLVLQVESKDNPTIDNENTTRIADIIGERIEQLGIKDRIIKVQGERQIVIQLPPCKNPDRVVDLISKSFSLEFKLVEEEKSLEKALKGDVPTGTEILYQREIDQTTGQYSKVPYLVKIKTLLSGEYIAKVETRINSYDRPCIFITFNASGAKLFEHITSQYSGKRLAIVLDKEIYSAPVIHGKISGGEAVLEGAFTLEEAKELAIVLRLDKYPAHTVVIEYRPLNREIWLGNN